MKTMIESDAQQHQFALFAHECTQLVKGKNLGAVVELNDPDLVHRIARVLRLQSGETCTIFDKNYHALVIIDQIDKKKIRVRIERVSLNEQIAPAITCYVPLLKREALADALYACVELGATHIELIKTHKVHRVYSDKELDHARNSMIAAAEQSKNFALPELGQIRSLEDALSMLPNKSEKVFFDPTGKPLLDVLVQLQATQPTRVVMMIGPEGDLIATEKELLKAHGFIFAALTPTVLRAQDALMIGLGALRAALRS